MTISFSDQVAEQRFDDTGLFEAAALDWARAIGGRDRYGCRVIARHKRKGVCEVAMRQIARAWRGPRLSKNGRAFAPSGYEVGAEVLFRREGSSGMVRGQVWSKAPGRGVWVVADRIAYWVETSSGRVFRQGDRPRFDAAIGVAA